MYIESFNKAFSLQETPLKNFKPISDSGMLQ